MYRNNLRI
jgi:hypothetical protein